MGRPRTRSFAKSGVDHNEDIRETENTEEEILSIQLPKPKRQSKLNGQNEQSRIKKSAPIGRPRKSQPKKRLLSDSDLKHTKRISSEQSQKSNLLDEDDNDEDELIDMEEKDYDNEEYDDDYGYDEDEIMFEEVDDPRDKDYSPKDYSSSYKKSRGKNSVPVFQRTPGTRLSNGNLVPFKNPVRPEDLTQGSSSSGNIPNLIDPLMIIQNSPKVSSTRHQNQSQSGESTSSHSRTVEPINPIMPQINNNCTPVHQNQPPRIISIPHTRSESETEFSHNLQSSQNESHRSSNNLSQTNNILTRNTLDQYNNQPSSMNQGPYTDVDESIRDNNTCNTTHISEPQETGRTSCDICNSTGCTTQKTSTTITIKMTTVTEADLFGNMTTRTFVETDISPVTGTIESSEQTEITVETSEHPSRMNAAPTNSPIVTDQNRSNETSSPVTLQETEVQESEKNQNHINQQQQMSQEPRTTIDPISDPVVDPVSDPVPDPVPDHISDPVPDHISEPVPDHISDPVVDPVPDPIDLAFGPTDPVSEPDPDPVDRDSSPNSIPICEAIPKPILKSIAKSIPKSIPKSISKSIPKSIPPLGFSSCSTQSQAAARLENANVMQHNRALQSVLNNATQLNLSSNSNSSQNRQPKVNRSTLSTRNRSLLPRPEPNIESIVNPDDLSPKNIFINSSDQTPNSTNSMSDVVRTNSITSPRDINEISDDSPDSQQSQRDSIKKKATTRKRSPSKPIVSPASKRKNKGPSEHKIIISPYMTKDGNTFTGSNSSMQEVTSSSTEICSSQQNSPKSTSATPPRPSTLNTNVITSTSVNTIDSTNSIPTITPPHNNSSEKSRGTASTTPHSNSTIQPSNSSTPQVSSSNNTCVTRDSVNNPFVIPEISESSSENTPMAHYNNNEILVRSGSSSKTISTNGGGVGYNSRSSSVANSIEVPHYYHIPPIEAIGSVTDIWNEWSKGINGNPSVILMMEQYGDKWVYENEFHLKKRRIIVKEVQVRSEQIGIYEALAELEKLRGENSLLWLADRIRTREQEEKVKI